MLKTVIVACLVSIALGSEEIFSYDGQGHAHKQLGSAGTAVTGEYSYTGDDGKTYVVKYIADENGYRAEGDHLPVAPKAEAAPAAPAAAAADDEAAAAPVAVKSSETPASTYSFGYPQFYQLPYYRFGAPAPAAAPSAGFSYGYGYSYPTVPYPYVYRYF